MLLRRIINIYNDLARKHGNVAVKDYRKYEKLEFEKNKLKLDIDFPNNYKQLGVYPKFLIFKMPNTSSHYNAPLNRFYNNYVTSICPRQLL